MQKANPTEDRSPPSLSARFCAWLVAWRWPLLALGIVAVAAAWLPAQRLEFDRAIDNMFAPDDPLLVPFRQLKRTFGGDEVVLAAYVDPNLISTDGIARLGQLTKQLEQVDGVQAAISLANLPHPYDVEGPDSRSLPLFEGYLVDADRETTAVVCLLTPRAEAVARGNTISRMRQIITATGDGRRWL
jgi:uncharacterized protein